MKVVVKSALLGLLGMALFFCFFMLVSIPFLGAAARLHGVNTPLQAADVVIAPTPWFRHVGLPLSAAAFTVGFAFGVKKFRKAGAIARSRT